MEVKNIASFLISAVLFSCFISESYAITGKATWFVALTPTTCFGGADEGNMIAAIPQELFDKGYKCGQMLTVSCIGNGYPCKNNNSIQVKIVTQSTSPAFNIIALSKDAFSAIANPDAGSCNIQFS